MRTTLLVATGILLASGNYATGATIGFQGNFTQDDDVQVFYYSVQNTGMVTVQTTSFAGGGFSPILSVFDSTGLFLFRDVGYDDNSDAYLEWNSVADELYIVALTQYGNYAREPYFADGFTEEGNGNYTAAPPYNPEIPGGSFLLPGPEQRTSAWAIEFTSADPTLIAYVPEPSTGVLGLAGALLFGCRIAARKRKQAREQAE